MKTEIKVRFERDLESGCPDPTLREKKTGSVSVQNTRIRNPAETEAHSLLASDYSTVREAAKKSSSTSGQAINANLFSSYNFWTKSAINI